MTIDVLGADLKSLRHAHPALIEKGEIGAVATIAEGVEKLGNFFASEDGGKCLLAFDFDLRPYPPSESEMIAKECAQSADGLVNRRAFEIALGLEMQEEIKNLPTLEGRDVLVWIVSYELVEPTEV